MILKSNNIIKFKSYLADTFLGTYLYDMFLKSTDKLMKGNPKLFEQIILNKNYNVVRNAGWEHDRDTGKL